MIKSLISVSCYPKLETVSEIFSGFVELFFQFFFYMGALMELEGLSRQGLFLAPKENIDFLQKRKKHLHSAAHCNTAHDLTQKLYDFRLEGVEIFKSNRSLFPWQGAALWVRSVDGIDIPMIQMRLKIPRGYSEEELLAHELVHAARVSFQEPLFEEIFAYKTSSLWFRRFFGPLFIYPWEATLFLLAPFGMFFYSAFVTSIFMLFFLARLCFFQSVFFVCQKKLMKIGVSQDKVLAVLIRLSDQEILKIFRLRSSKIKKYLTSKKNPRIALILDSYFK